MLFEKVLPVIVFLLVSLLVAPSGQTTIPLFLLPSLFIFIPVSSHPNRLIV